VAQAAAPEMNKRFGTDHKSVCAEKACKENHIHAQQRPICIVVGSLQFVQMGFEGMGSKKTIKRRARRFLQVHDKPLRCIGLACHGAKQCRFRTNGARCPVRINIANCATRKSGIRMNAKQFKHPLEKRRFSKIIMRHPTEILCSGLFCSQYEISNAANIVFVPYNTNARVTGSELLSYFECVIGGGVVVNCQSKIVTCLGQKRFNSICQICLAVSYRQSDIDQSCSHSCTISHASRIHQPAMQRR